MQYEIILGGSGRWVAREVIEMYPNGKIAKRGRKFWGHCPKSAGSQQIDVIKRQLRRQIDGEIPTGVAPSLNGGKVWIEQV